MSHRSVSALLILGSALAGYLVAAEANSVLRISFAERDALEIGPPRFDLAGGTGSLQAFDTVVLPSGGSHPLLSLAANELADALAARTGSRPVIGHQRLPDHRRMIEVNVAPDEPSGESFRLQGDEGVLSIASGTLLGAARGAAHLAALIYGGAGDDAFAAIDSVIGPAMRYRFVDLGGVGIKPDSAAWRAVDYSHHNNPLAQVLFAEPPYVDMAGLQEVGEQFRQFIDRVALYGYNGVVMKGFLEFVNFDYVGSGTEIYEIDSPYRARRTALQEGLRDVLRDARSMGISVILSTDMLALSEPLEAYLRARFGRIDASDPRLWDVYRAGLRELFEVMPDVDGLMIRIGEAGTVYNIDGWRYYSSLDVRTVEAVRLMLETMTAEAASHGKEVFFRSWSVGVGEVGAMHTSTEMYDRILAGVDVPNLVVSTKFVAGDFYSHLPLNPTLAGGEQRRIIEMQARREFEFFASFPNFLGPEHQQALRDSRRLNPRIEGLWVWTQEGGPQRRSPISLYPFHGFWQLIDADVYVAARLGWDPDADIRGLTEAWVRRTFAGDDVLVAAISDVLLASREPARKGLYVGPFARREVRTLGLEPPPMMWLFEWDILTASSAALSAIYFISRDQLEEAIDEGYDAVELTRQLRERLSGVTAEATNDPALFARLLESIDYQINLLETLAAYRAAFMRYYRWLDRGGSAAYRDWRAALGRFDDARAIHLATYAEDLDFRSLSFFDADAGFAHARRARPMAWLARLLLVILAGSVLAGATRFGRLIPVVCGRRAFRLLWQGCAAPDSISGDALNRTDRVILIVLPGAVICGALLVTTSFLAPTTMALGMLAITGVAMARLLVQTEDPVREVGFTLWPIALMMVLPLAVSAVRGPGYFWFLFWTSDLFRTTVFVGAFVVGAWFLRLRYSSLRSGPTWRIGAFGHVLLVGGLPLLLLGTVVSLAGLEAVLTAINDELVVLPLALSRILGITTHLNIPLDLPGAALGVGAAACGVGALLVLLSRQRPGGPAMSVLPLEDAPPIVGGDRRASGGQTSTRVHGDLVG